MTFSNVDSFRKKSLKKCVQNIDVNPARYIGSIFYIPLTMAITAGILYLLQFQFTLNELLISVLLSLLMVSIFFPLFYLVKPDYIFVTMIIGMVAAVLLLPRFIDFFQEELTEFSYFLTNLAETTLYIGSTVSVLVFYLLSWGVSTVVYKHKTF